MIFVGFFSNFLCIFRLPQPVDIRRLEVSQRAKTPSDSEEEEKLEVHGENHGENNGENHGDIDCMIGSEEVGICLICS